jgi:hypothetical protein
MIDRSKTLARVTRECLAVHDKPTWANLSALMSEEERAAFHGKEVEIVESSATDGPETDLHKSSVARSPEVTDTSVPSENGSKTRTSENPYEAMRAAERDLIDARQHQRECRAATIEARAAFAVALQTWNLGAPVMNHEQQARAFIATSNAARAARAAAAPWRPNVTQTARAMDAAGRRAGGGNAFRRGPDGQRSYTKEAAAALGYRLPTPAKGG